MFPSITFYQESKVWKLEKILKYAPISTQKKEKRKKKKEKEDSQICHGPNIYFSNKSTYY